MHRRPDEFADVRFLVACQTLSPAMTVRSALTRQGIHADHLARFSHLVQLHTGFTLEQMSPVAAARSIRLPTLMYQVREGVMTTPADVESIFEAIPPVVPKELF